MADIIEQELNKLSAVFYAEPGLDDLSETSSRRSSANAWKLAIELRGKYPDDPKVACAAGLVAYEGFLNGVVDRNDAAKQLFDCVRLWPGDPDGTLYLGFILYDSRRFDEAFEWLAKVDLDHFENIDQRWKAIKAQELRLSCRLRANDPSLDIRDFESYFESVLNEDMDDVPDPWELLEAVCDLPPSAAIRNRIDINYVTTQLHLLKMKLGMTD